ncbi:MAG: hypothetical protein EZS28_015289 [Streblomastix strix]|uniref:Uncharacterized protein n=1 Tax=Streblomastix strix TaxID=222440 RepID=A0A5J4W3E0_9EUKA|nr:MAG: hypothetical protein EZS28_015289 [Streblomastix strix]
MSLDTIHLSVDQSKRKPLNERNIQQILDGNVSDKFGRVEEVMKQIAEIQTPRTVADAEHGDDLRRNTSQLLNEAI